MRWYFTTITENGQRGTRNGHTGRTRRKKKKKKKMTDRSLKEAKELEYHCGVRILPAYQLPTAEPDQTQSYLFCKKHIGWDRGHLSFGCQHAYGVGGGGLSLEVDQPRAVDPRSKAPPALLQSGGANSKKLLLDIQANQSFNCDLLHKHTISDSLLSDPNFSFSG